MMPSAKINVVRQRGVSLVELMVGIAIALILLTGVLTIMLRVSTSGADSVQSTRLNQQMRGTMDFVTKELQRAGYVDWRRTWGYTGTGVATFTNMDAFTDVDVRDFYQGVLPVIDQFGEVRLQKFTSGVGTAVSGSCPPQADCDCVLYSYDLDQNGQMSTGLFELFGIRRIVENDRGVLQMRTSGVHDCISPGWAAISDDNVNITSFRLNLVYQTGTGTGNATVYQYSGNSWDWDNIFRDDAQCVASTGLGTGFDQDDVVCLERRSVLVEMEGELADDPEIRMELQNRVKLKNDRVKISP